MRERILLAFIAYGLAVGILSVWWWQTGADSPFLPNIPGVLLGDGVYDFSIQYLGDPYSPQAHYTIPWLLRIPQVYVPASLLLWGVIGLAIYVALRRSRKV